MKVTLVILSLVAVLGTLYGLAFIGIIPTQQWADKSPRNARILAALHLAKSKHKPKMVVAKVARPAASYSTPIKAPPAPDNGGAGNSPLLPPPLSGVGGSSPLSMTGVPTVARGSPTGTSGPPPPDTGAKLMAIYATMSPDDIARIWTKLPDTNVVSDLMQLDEKKAGKVLAALPADRAAKISLLMSRRSSTSPDVTVSRPQSSL